MLSTLNAREPTLFAIEVVAQIICDQNSYFFGLVENIFATLDFTNKFKPCIKVQTYLFFHLLYHP